MKIIERQRKEVDLKEFVKRSAKTSDFSELIDEPCILKENGEVKVIYDELDWDFKPLKSALQSIRYETGKRTRGLTSTSRIFGYRPRNAIRGEYCSVTSLAMEHPKEHDLICSFAKKIEDVYFRNNPEKFDKHKELADNNMKDEWRIDGTIFTSGIVNKNNPLKYHFDTGNFNNVFSAMLVFKEGVEGGYLSLPEFDLGFKLNDRSIFLFDGQGILHGVTPIKYVSEKPFRYSIVFYSLKGMWKCLTVDEELIRIRRKKTEREHNRLKPEHKEELRKRLGKQ